MSDLINISFGDAALTALLGYLVVFFGLILLMVVVIIMGKIMVSRANKAKAAAPAAPAAPAPEAPAAPGSAGELKLYDTDPRDAAMIMAIVADALGKPINQLRFISIKEVKEDEV
ncbi:MAG: OadG family protein [Oscillospiraceae bacterium]|jgi:Na+-transporting methylmalonyl-CoA/oxaloacetate decarboxylase gamma subunit|nr:OadG family protein [Oscillospiraceae bacterium]